jgi:hypothetical protein
MSAAPSRARSQSFSRKTPFKHVSVRWVSRSRRCGAHSASRQRGALPSRHGLETTSVDVSRYSECAERRASVLAPPPRLLARRTLFCLIAHEKCVPAHRKRKKTHLILFTHSARHAADGRHRYRLHAPISEIPDPWAMVILLKFGRWSRCQSIRAVVGELFFEHQYAFLTYGLRA